MTLTSNMPITALSHPTSWTVAMALAAMPFVKKSPAKSGSRLNSAPPIWLTSAMTFFRRFESPVEVPRTFPR
jgi:hypothetical protein